MRYRADHKFHAHRQLVTAAATLAKAEGFAATPLRRLTAAAGRSTGAFYALLDTKEELLRSIVEQELERTLYFLGGELPPDRSTGSRRSPADNSDTQGDDVAAMPPPSDPRSLRQILSAYLRLAHAQDSAGGCVLPALAAEIARADPLTRRACEQGLRRVHTHLAHRLDDRAAAWAVLSQTVGALLLARTMASAASSEEVLTSALNDLLARHP